MLTDFQNSLTARVSRKFVTKSYLNTTPHPKRVATLPSEISMFKKSQFTNKCMKQAVMQDLATQTLF